MTHTQSLDIVIFSSSTSGPLISKIFEDHGHTTYLFTNLAMPNPLRTIQELNPDYIITCGFATKIPNNIIALAKNQAFNFHPSLLPKYRSALPDFWAIKNQEKISGLTIHKLTDTWDAGDIVVQIEFPLSATETTGTYWLKTQQIIAQFLPKLMPRFESNTFEIKTQPDSPYYPRPSADDMRINWEDDAHTIDALIRAGSAYTPAITILQNSIIKILEADILDSQDLAPGHLSITPTHVLIGTKTYDLKLNIMQTDFGTFSPARLFRILNITDLEKL